jgi:hypothetical protein
MLPPPPPHPPPFVVGFTFLAACSASCFIHVGYTSSTSSRSFPDANHPRVSPGTTPFLLRLLSVGLFPRFHTGDKSRLGMKEVLLVGAGFQ